MDGTEAARSDHRHVPARLLAGAALAGLLALAVGPSLAPGGPAAAFHDVHGFAFTNTLKVDAHDLRLQLTRKYQAAELGPEDDCRVKGKKRKKRRIVECIFDAPVAPAETVQVAAFPIGDRGEIKRWWWTDERRKRIGTPFVGCQPADGCAAVEITQTPTSTATATATPTETPAAPPRR